MRKILIFLLTWILAIDLKVTALQAAVIASGDDCGENCHWEFDDNGKMTFTGSGAMTNYKAKCNDEGTNCWSNAPWDYYAIRSVEIGEGITTIGTDAFYSNSEISSISLPSSLERIGGEAFHGNVVLTNVELPEGLLYIGPRAFSFAQLADLYIPSSVQTIDKKAFVGWNAKDMAQISSVYCPEHLMEQCQKAVSNQGIEPVPYTKTSDGQYVVRGKAYANFSDLQSGKYIPKRIYTIEEAIKISKPTGNTIKLRYK